MGELVLVVAGTVVQIFGVVITIKGAREVWRDIATSDDRFLAPMISAWRRAVAGVRRLLRLPGRPQPMSSTRGPGVRTSGSGQLSTGYAPLDPSLTIDGAVAELDARIRTMQDRFQAEIQTLRRNTKEAVQELTHKQKLAEQDAKAAAESERQRAVRGLRTEAYGFLLLTIGTLIQTGGTFAGLGS